MQPERHRRRQLRARVVDEMRLGIVEPGTDVDDVHAAADGGVQGDVAVLLLRVVLVDVQ